MDGLRNRAAARIRAGINDEHPLGVAAAGGGNPATCPGILSPTRPCNAALRPSSFTMLLFLLLILGVGSYRLFSSDNSGSMLRLELAIDNVVERIEH